MKHIQKKCTPSTAADLTLLNWMHQLTSTISTDYTVNGTFQKALSVCCYTEGKYHKIEISAQTADMWDLCVLCRRIRCSVFKGPALSYKCFRSKLDSEHIHTWPHPLLPS